ncbi:MAG: thioredoxin family protein [Pseudomonadota bacterium]|nr:thioredoxin family protein [Pseudomonadota bacterium]
MRRLFTSFCFLTLLAVPALAGESMVRVALVAEHTGVAAGQPFRVGILLEPPPGWHTYYKNPGDAGMATALAWTLPPGFSAGDIDWPEPEQMHEGSLTVYGYGGQVFLPVTIVPPASLDASATYPVKVKATWLACKNICIPESANLEIDLPVVAAPAPSAQAGLFKPAHHHPPAAATPFLPLILLAAMLGGLILNLMPCVLPVLSLKALAIAKKSGREHHVVIHMGIAYTLGILLSFAIIGGALLALRQGGEAIGWGYQMQSPAFVGFLIYLLFMVGLNLSGLFHLPVLLGGVGGGIAAESSARGSFFTGVLAVMVATPCTAPFMAPAVGVALTLPSWEAMLIFEALGFGLASPFLAVSLFPKLLRFLPKPGVWMETFKELLAFPMYASVIWLLWVLSMQTGGGVTVALSGMLAIVIIIWMKKLFGEDGAYRITALALYALVLGLSLPALNQMELGGMQRKMDEMGITAVDYSAEKLAELRKTGTPVFVDATAAWCITCQLNGRTVIHTTRVMEAFKQHGVTLMVADWTRRNDDITEFLSSFGYKGVPLYVFYPAHGKPVVLPQLLTQDKVIETISR